MTDLVIHDSLALPSWMFTWTYSRAGGPGGQHVNTAETRVQLRFELENCHLLSEPVKRRLRQQNRSWLTDDGALQMSCGRHRSRQRNIEEVRERLADAVRTALVAPPRRRRTRPSRGSQQRRLQKKRIRSEVKQKRGRVSDE